MEKPPGSTKSHEELSDSLRLHLQIYLQQRKDRYIWLAVENETVVGLLDFYHRPEELYVRFICAIPPRRGTGTRLLRHLAKYGLSQQIPVIKTTVSSLDLRAQEFYFSHLGFQQIGSRTEDPGFDLYIVTIHPQDLLNEQSSVG
jgi:GNAT superfamily N-acetyltransferase